MRCEHVFARHYKKDGKEHRYWSVVENRRVAGGRVVQRHVLYLGEINSSQELAWRKSIDVLEDGQPAPRTYALFPEDRCEGLLPDESIVRLKLKSMQLHRPRHWGACWLALSLWQTLDLDVFWAERAGDFGGQRGRGIVFFGGAVCVHLHIGAVCRDGGVAHHAGIAV